MISETLAVHSFSFKMRQYFMLLKVRLSSLVVFSGAFGYLLANSGDIDWLKLAAFCLGSFMITGAANTINQIIEKDLDKLMKRTAGRPLPTGHLSVNEAAWYAAVLGVLGVALIAAMVNPLAAVLGLLSLVLYAFVYTPLKQKSPIAVFVGAIPGALPPLIGWAAQSGTLGHEALIIFGLQFVWQFPHFWAIAWVADDDYRRAGFRLLPSGGNKDFNTAFSIMTYTLFLLPLGMLPTHMGITGQTAAIVATVCGLLFLLQSVYLLKANSNKAAMQMMFGSFVYLPIVQIVYLIDKI